ncbi:MAG: MlaD family protein [Gammaproteobacteria bacterium]|jgi:paraquat-inducible protein B
MTDRTAGDLPESNMPEAVVRKRSGLSIVWVIPIVAAIIGAWVAYKSYSEIGPTITITFENAEGLEAGKTKVKFKDVEVGMVQAIDLEKDLQHVVVTVQMNAGAKGYLTEKTRFWVVKARITAGSVTGLGTLLGGAYIAIDPVASGKHVDKFTGLESAPVVTTDQPGRHFLLKAGSRGSLDVGAPIYFRQIKVGEVVSYQLAENNESVDFKIFIDAPHHLKITENTRFWNASGIDVSLSATGVKVDMESAVSLLTGGLAFGLPPNTPPGDVVPENTVFTLHDRRSDAFEQEITLRERYLLYFNGTVRGLAPGAPVEFRGITVGKVVSIDLEFDAEAEAILIPVVVDLEPERFGGGTSGIHAEKRKKILEDFVARGFRAQLKTGNLLTGKLYVDLDFFPNVEKATMSQAKGYRVIPTMPTSIEELTRSVYTVLDKMKEFPYGRIGSDMTKALASLDKTIVQADGTLKSIDGMFAKDSAMSQELQATLRELSDAARSLRVLADYLERHPEALLRGKERK